MQRLDHYENLVLYRSEDGDSYFVYHYNGHIISYDSLSNAAFTGLLMDGDLKVVLSSDSWREVINWRIKWRENSHD